MEDNWKTWIQKEKMLWCSMASADFIVGLAPFKWQSAWKSCSVLPKGSLSSSEKKDFDPDVQIILHDSGNHGKYSITEKLAARRETNLNQNVLLNTEVVTGTACIFKWVDDESDDDREYLWLGIVISVAEGSVVDPDSKILVRWCPNDKKRT